MWAKRDIYSIHFIVSSKKGREKKEGRDEGGREEERKGNIEDQ